ncbi:Sucraseferredoxin-like protein, partial [Piptocephalis cylindrospora]
YIFVCTHGERDCRCGEKGGKFHEALEHAVNQDTQIDGVSDVHVHRISHIGGHKYAANAILYPNGDWYGHLQVGQEYELLETLQKGQGMKEHWRGRIGLDKKEQEA